MIRVMECSGPGPPWAWGPWAAVQQRIPTTTPPANSTDFEKRNRQNFLQLVESSTLMILLSKRPWHGPKIALTPSSSSILSRGLPPAMLMFSSNFSSCVSFCFFFAPPFDASPPPADLRGAHSASSKGMRYNDTAIPDQKC